MINLPGDIGLVAEPADDAAEATRPAQLEVLGIGQLAGVVGAVVQHQSRPRDGGDAGIGIAAAHDDVAASIQHHTATAGATGDALGELQRGPLGSTETPVDVTAGDVDRTVPDAASLGDGQAAVADAVGVVVLNVEIAAQQQAGVAAAADRHRAGAERVGMADRQGAVGDAGATAVAVGVGQEPHAGLGLDERGDSRAVVVDLRIEFVVRQAPAAQRQGLVRVRIQKGEGTGIGELDRRGIIAKQLAVGPEAGVAGAEGEEAVGRLMTGADPAQTAVAGAQVEHKVRGGVRGGANAAGLTAVGKEEHVDAVGHLVAAIGDDLRRALVGVAVGQRLDAGGAAVVGAGQPAQTAEDAVVGLVGRSHGQRLAGGDFHPGAGAAEQPADGLRSQHAQHGGTDRGALRAGV